MRWRANLTLVIVTVLALLVPRASAQASAPNLIAHWNFDEGTGTTAYDSVGGNHGTLVNGPMWTTGQMDGALEFDGLDDYVDMNTGSELDFERTDAFTLSAWYKGSGPHNTVLSKMDKAAQYRGYDVFLNGGYVEAHLINTWASNAIRVDGTLYPVTDSYWHHIVVTYDGSSSATGLKIYVDAMEEVTSVYRDSLSSTIQNSVSFKIAARSDGAATTQHLNGKIDDVRAYNRALSAEEVERLYWEGFSRSEFAIMAIEDALDKKLEALERVDAALESESLAYQALEELLESGDYGDLKKGDIVKAKQKIHSAMQHEEQSINALEKSIGKLEDSLSALGYEPEPPEPNE